MAKQYGIKLRCYFSSFVPRKEKGKIKKINALRCYWEHLKEHIENLKNNSYPHYKQGVLIDVVW